MTGSNNLVTSNQDASDRHEDTRNGLEESSEEQGQPTIDLEAQMTIDYKRDIMLEIRSKLRNLIEGT